MDDEIPCVLVRVHRKALVSSYGQQCYLAAIVIICPPVPIQTFRFWIVLNDKLALLQFSSFNPRANKMSDTVHLQYQFSIFYNNSQSPTHADRQWLQSSHKRQDCRLTKLSSQNGSKTNFGHQIRSEDSSELLLTESDN